MFSMSTSKQQSLDIAAALIAKFCPEPGIMTSELTPKAHLCIHFDINKTMIMSDVVSGRSLDETLSSLLSECTWGLCEQKPLEKRSCSDWVVCHPTPENEAPIEGAITLGTYLEDHTLTPKKEQTRIKRAFTNEGNLGHQFLPYQEKLKNALLLDPSINFSDLHYLSSGCYHIIPSFFRLVEYLAEQNLKFNILFRTFGSDIANVCDEFNLFCSGGHPAYVPSRKLDGSDPLYPKDLRITLPYHHGVLSHTGPGAEGLHMKFTEDGEVESAISCRRCVLIIDAFFSRLQNEAKVSGADAVYKVIMQDWFNLHISPTSSTRLDPAQQEKNTYCAALQDDFHWWHTANDESEHSGKLMMVDTSFTKVTPDAPTEQVIQVNYTQCASIGFLK